MKMSGNDDVVAEARMMCCASCGIAVVDDVKLKPCDRCDLVRYCSDECQELHRPEHETKCEERAAELRDEILFRQPEGSHLGVGDCPICCLPFPLDPEKSPLYSCCGKRICNGCSYADNRRQRRENMRVKKCPFCRHPIPKSEEEGYKNLMKRVAANDPDAVCKMGARHYDEGDYDSALKYWERAADLGNVNSHYHLSRMYSEGEGVEKDEKKKIFHLEEAAILGHPYARYNLACYEVRSGKIERAVKHLIIAANLGVDQSINGLKQMYKDGLVSKDDFAAALRGHHAAVNATKSPQREAAQKYLNECKESVGRPSKW